MTSIAVVPIETPHSSPDQDDKAQPFTTKLKRSSRVRSPSLFELPLPNIETNVRPPAGFASNDHSCRQASARKLKPDSGKERASRRTSGSLRERFIRADACRLQSYAGTGYWMAHE
jgi:hypothetical protein